MAAEIESYKKLLASKDSEINRLNEECSKTSKLLDDAYNQVSAAKTETKRAVAENETLSTQLKSAKKSDSQKELKEKNKEIASYKDELAKAQEDLKRYNSAIQAKEAEVVKAQKELYKSNKKIADLEKELQNSREVRPQVNQEEQESDQNSIFEQFIVDCFNIERHKCFSRKESCSLDPEIIIELSAYSQTKTFAVAIDYKSKWGNYSLKWEYLKAYRDYAKKIDGKVYFVLGVGGKPEQPRDVYIVPLSSMKKGQTYTKSDWSDYRYKNPTGNLRYDIHDDNLHFTN